MRRLTGLALVIAGAAVLADWVTTQRAVSHHVHSLVWNSGFGGGLFAGQALLTTALLALVVAYLVTRVARVQTIPLAIGLGLLLGGMAGNLVEKLFGGHGGAVADFLTVTSHVTFNVADACAFGGLVIVLIGMATTSTRGKEVMPQ